MKRIRIRTPSRLHFGLLGWGPGSRRQFGGVGLMIDAPGLDIEASPADTWHTTGPLAARAAMLCERIAAADPSIQPAAIRILHAPSEHVGLGTGTQLGMALARILTERSGQSDMPVEHLARLAGRGRRSGVGLHGFARGGLIVDGGHPQGRHDSIPPMLARFGLPDDWSVMIATPSSVPGLHGGEEQRAFARIEQMPLNVTGQLSRLVLLDLLPAAAESDLPAFGASLEIIQQIVGQVFSDAQGGTYASEESAGLVKALREVGLLGVGQSSWGPTVYGFTDSDEATRRAIQAELASRFSIEPASFEWSKPSKNGAVLLG